MSLKVEFTFRDVYGNATRYPANQDARLVCELAGTKTITDAMRTTVLTHGGTMEEVLRKR